MVSRFLAEHDRETIAFGILSVYRWTNYRGQLQAVAVDFCGEGFCVGNEAFA